MRGNRLLAAALMIAAFGPYVAPGVRTEQALVYIIAPFALLLTWGRATIPRTVGRIAAVWCVYVVVAAFGGLVPPYNPTSFEFGQLWASLDNLLLPLAVITIACALFDESDPPTIIRTVAWWLVAMMLLNTVAALMQSQEVADWSQWWGATQAGVATTAENAATNGRFSGLINQPAEAGLLYSSAMLAAIYLLADTRALRMFVVLLVLGYGGMLTVSKVFLLVGLPIVLWQLIALKKGRGVRLYAALAALGGAYVVLQAGWLPAWTGAAQLSQILPKRGESFISAATASRLGESSSLEALVDSVMETSPLVGMGARGLAAPYDNGFVEALVLAGVVGVACYALTLWLWWLSAWRGPRSSERTFMVGLVLVAAGASMGLPALTANRGATALWILLTLLACSLHKQQPADDEITPRRRPAPTPRKSQRLTQS